MRAEHRSGRARGAAAALLVVRVPRVPPVPGERHSSIQELRLQVLRRKDVKSPGECQKTH